MARETRRSVSVLRRVTIGLGIFIGAIILLVVAFGLFFDVNRYKPQIEAAVAKSTGMQLQIKGQVSLRIFPSVRVVLHDVNLSNRGNKVFDASSIEASPEIRPLLFHRRVVIDHVLLDRPDIHVVKYSDGRMNYEVHRPTASRREPPGRAGKKQPSPSEIHSIGIRNGNFSYVDQSTRQNGQVKGIQGDFSQFSWGGSGLNSLACRGNLRAQSLQFGKITVSDFKTRLSADRGVIYLDSTQATVFGGNTISSATIDLRGRMPRFKINESAQHVDLVQVPSNGGRLTGFIDQTLELTAAGRDSNSIARTAIGALSIRGKNLTVHGLNLDELSNKAKAAQTKDLAQIGSSVINGAIGSALGRAGIAANPSSQSTVIQNLVSDWAIAGGKAHAKDVALSTEKTRIAFKGDINLVNRTYQDFYVATVDPTGCAQMKVGLVGAIDKPRPNVAPLVEEQARSALEKEAASALGQQAGISGADIAGLIGGKSPTSPAKPNESKPASPSGCDQFYSGAVVQNAK